MGMWVNFNKKTCKAHICLAGESFFEVNAAAKGNLPVTA